MIFYSFQCRWNNEFFWIVWIINCCWMKKRDVLCNPTSKFHTSICLWFKISQISRISMNFQKIFYVHWAKYLALVIIHWKAAQQVILLIYDVNILFFNYLFEMSPLGRTADQPLMEVFGGSARVLRALKLTDVGKIFKYGNQTHNGRKIFLFGKLYGAVNLKYYQQDTFLY